MANHPLLSIGMIVKNESRCLEKCLKALQPLRDAIPCELVIADTGSTDDTRDIAAQYADILFDFPWINDFSAARNAVIERCTGKWYLTVDADEYLEPDIREIVNFLCSPQSDAITFCTVIQRNFAKASMEGIYSDFPAVRMIRMAISPRYHGTIHEAFQLLPEYKWKNLDRTVFDHDGYTVLSPEHVRKKSERNMVLLEKELENDPKNLRRILQCLESSITRQKQSYYARLGMKQLMNESPAALKSVNWASGIARKAVEFAVSNHLPEVEEWVKWSLKTFPDSSFVQVDVNFHFAQYLYQAERYDELIQISKEYFKGLQVYRKTGFSSPSAWCSAVFCAHPIREDEMRCMVGHALREEEQFQNAISVLSKVNLAVTEDNVLPPWLKNMEKMADKKKAINLAGTSIGNLLKLRDSDSGWERAQYKSCIKHITEAFAQKFDNEDAPWKLYRNVPGTIGLCVKIMEVESKTDAEALARQIENWDEFMPSALNRLMTLGAALPDRFFSMNRERLELLAGTLPKISKDLAAKALAYTEPEVVTDLPRLAFAFTLVAAVLANKDMLKGEQGESLCARFAELSAVYLSEFYSESLLSDESSVACLPALHRFAWYYAQAWGQKGSDGYYRLLLKALRQTGDMLYTIKFLTEHSKNEEKDHCDEASRELLELAEKVRMILAQYDPTDPSVVELKQTPAYQKVAHLIEQ